MKLLRDRQLNKIFYLAGWLCFVLLVVVDCVRTLYLFPGTSNILTDADLIQLPTMFLDLKVDLANFWGWKLPEAPYYFPDTVIFLLINWLVQNTWRSIIVYSLVQACLLVLALSWIYREMGGKKTTVFLTVLLGTMSIFTKIYTSLFQSTQGLITPYIYYLCSYIHFGTYICALICLAASLMYLKHSNNFLLIAIILLIFLTTASDLLFAIYFTLPLIATLLIANKSKIFLIDRKIKRFCYLIFLTSLLAYIYNKYFDILASTTTVEIKLGKIFISIKTILVDLWNRELSEQIFLFSAIIIPLIFIIFFIYTSLNNNGTYNSFQKDRAKTYALIASIYVISAVILNLLAVIILGKYTTIPDSRYLTFVYYSPGAIALTSIGLWLEKIKQIGKIAVATSVTLSIIAATSLATKEFPAISRVLSPPNYATCFNLDLPQAGLAGYWQSKPLIAFSQGKIQIATVTEEGKPSIGNSNRYWYTDSWAKPGTLPQFRFILMKSLDKKAIAFRYGQPDRIEACVNSEIWWYDNPEVIYSQLMRDGL